MPCSLGDMTQPHLIKYTVIAPVFCEEESLTELADRVAATFEEMGEAGSFELLIVDDGSTDGSAQIIRDLESERTNVRAVTLRRNCPHIGALVSEIHSRAWPGCIIFAHCFGYVRAVPIELCPCLKKIFPRLPGT